MTQRISDWPTKVPAGECLIPNGETVLSGTQSIFGNLSNPNNRSEGTKS